MFKSSSEGPDRVTFVLLPGFSLMAFTSVARFRGQQAPAIILVDVELSPGEDLAERRRMAFIGMTRASLRLDVVHVPPAG